MAVCVLLAVVLAGVGVVIVRPGPVAGWLAAATGTRPSASPGAKEPPPPPVLAAANGAPEPTDTGVRAAIDDLVTNSVLGKHVHMSVRDVQTGDILYGHEAEDGAVPASTTKLITAATVLAARGPAYRIETRAVAGPNPGEVVIVGAGDPTLAAGATGTYPGAARLDRLAAQVKKALGEVAPTKVIIDKTLYSGSVWGPGWDADIPTGGCATAITALMIDGGRVDPKAPEHCSERTAKPALAAGRAFAKALGLPAGAVAEGKAPAAAGAGTPPAGATDNAGVRPGTVLGRVPSPPMIRLVEFMLLESDNMIAEALARQVALARGQPASFAGGATAVDAVLTELGLDADQSTLSDGSGLSRHNRIAPALLTKLLSLTAGGSRPELTGLFAGLPVGAWSGTLDYRFDPSADGGKTGAGAGVVRAKTGTLSGVNAIAGVVRTPDGRLLAFAALANQVPVGAWAAQPALDRIVAALAKCGCR